MNDLQTPQPESAPAPDEKPIDLTSGEVRMYTDEDIWTALRECYDPEIPVNIVDLGLVYEMHAEGDTVFVKMTLTAPGCGMGPMIAADVKSRLTQIPGVSKAMVELVFTPLWATSMMSQDAKLMLGVQ